jgi:hypothetical protein
LPVIRGLLDAGYIYAADKISALRDEAQSNAVWDALGIHGQIGITAGCVEVLDGLAQIVFMEWRTLSEGQAAAQFFIRERLIGWLECDASDRKSFVLEGFFERGSVFFRSDGLAQCGDVGEQNQERGC